jgi:four helix bundle protein
MSDTKQSGSIIAGKSYAFALEIIGIYKFLSSEKKEFVLSKQLLRCGTSIGANVHEAVSSESKRDFVHKLSIALKEAKETSYWLNLLRDGDYILDEQFQRLNSSCTEIIKILNSIILTTKARYFTKTTLNS